MIKRLNLEEAREEWGAYRGSFTKQLGRSFVACCVEQGRFECESGLTPVKAVELLLGHEQLSTSNINYLQMYVNPKRLRNVMLQKVTPESPIKTSDGCPISYGV